MRVLFSTGAVYGVSLRWAMRMAASAGCDGIELVLDPWSILAGPDRVLRLSRRLGVPVAVVHPSLFHSFGMNRLPRAFERLGDWATALGCSLVVVHPPRMRQLESSTSRFDAGLAALRRVSSGDVQVTVENVPVFAPEEWADPYIRPARLADFARERGLRLTLDTTHLASTGLPLIREYEGVAGLINHVHLSDYRLPPPLLDKPQFDTYLKHHQLPGAGQLPLQAFLHRLRAGGYSGAITLELSPVALQIWRPSRAIVLLRQAVEYVRSGWVASDEQAQLALGATASAVGAG